MKIILYLFLLSYQLLYSFDQIEITNDKVKLEAFEIGYIHDSNDALTINDILKTKFKTTTSSRSFGIFNNITWLKIKIKNSTDLSKKIYLHSNFAFVNKEITIYEVLNNQEIKYKFYNLFDKNISEELAGSTLVYDFLLLPKEEKTIFIKKYSSIYQLVSFKLYDEHNSHKVLINKNFYSNIIVVILFALGIYTFILSFFIRRKEFIYYSLYLINASLGLVYMYGTIYNNLNIYGSVASWFSLTSILVSPFLILFIKSIFDISCENKGINSLLNSVIYLSFIYMFIAIFIDLDFIIKVVGSLFIYTFVVLIYVALYFYKRKHPLAKIFLLAYLIYIFGMGLTIFMLLGFSSYNFWNFHASGFGLIFEALLFSYLIKYRIKLLENEIIKQQNSLILKNKKAQMGDMIGAITHQWKQPLTAISSISVLLQYQLSIDKKLSAAYLEPKLLKINEKIMFLIEILDDFRDFFNPNKIHKSVNIENIINKIVILCKDDMLANDIHISVDFDIKNKIDIYYNDLVHILLNLIQNSKESFIKNKIENRVIKIVGNIKDDKIIIDIKDNAGGIKKEDIAKVFDEFFTTKDKKEGSGLGLYICRLILEEQLNGTIEVEKIDKGTMFRIIL